MLRALGTLSVRHRWAVIAMWLLLVGGVLVAGRSYGGSFSNDLSVSGTDSQAAYDALVTTFPEMSGDGMQFAIHDDRGVASAAVRGAVEDLGATGGAEGPPVGSRGATAGELGEVYGRLKTAGRPLLEQGETTCCYAKSEKTWVHDPQGVAWETFLTVGESPVYGEDAELSGPKSACCSPAPAATAQPASTCC